MPAISVIITEIMARTHSRIFFVYENSAQAEAGAGFRDKTYCQYVAKRNRSLLRLNEFAVERGSASEF